MENLTCDMGWMAFSLCVANWPGLSEATSQISGSTAGAAVVVNRRPRRRERRSSRPTIPFLVSMSRDAPSGRGKQAASTGSTAEFRPTCQRARHKVVRASSTSTSGPLTRGITFAGSCLNRVSKAVHVSLRAPLVCVGQRRSHRGAKLAVHCSAPVSVVDLSMSTSGTTVRVRRPRHG